MVGGGEVGGSVVGGGVVDEGSEMTTFTDTGLLTILQVTRCAFGGAASSLVITRNASSCPHLPCSSLTTWTKCLP